MRSEKYEDDKQVSGLLCEYEKETFQTVHYDSNNMKWTTCRSKFRIDNPGKVRVNLKPISFE